MKNFVRIDEQIDNLVNKEIKCWEEGFEEGVEDARVARAELEKQRQEMQISFGNVPYPATARQMYKSVRDNK